MKKFCYVSMVLAVALVCLVGCSKKTDFDAVKKQISYEQTSFFMGENENLCVELATANREIALIADGTVGEMAVSTVLQLQPKKSDYFDKAFNYKIVGDKGEIMGVMDKNVIGLGYNAKVNDIEKVGSIINVVISAENINEDLKMNNMLAGHMDAMTALECVYNEVKDYLEENEFVKGKFTREVGIKVVRDRSRAETVCYWYVTMTKDTSTMMAFLVDMQNGNIISKKF